MHRLAEKIWVLKSSHQTLRTLSIIEMFCYGSLHVVIH